MEGMRSMLLEGRSPPHELFRAHLARRATMSIGLPRSSVSTMTTSSSWTVADVEASPSGVIGSSRARSPCSINQVSSVSSSRAHWIVSMEASRRAKPSSLEGVLISAESTELSPSPQRKREESSLPIPNSHSSCHPLLLVGGSIHPLKPDRRLICQKHLSLDLVKVKN